MHELAKNSANRYTDIGAYSKLDANETFDPPSPKVMSVLLSESMRHLGFYGDPNCTIFRKAIAQKYNVDPKQIMVGNGADEILQIIMTAFMKEQYSICFPQITYEFYECFCNAFNIKYCTIPMKDDFSVNTKALTDTNSNIILANPNSPTGIYLSMDEVVSIVCSKPQRIVVLDEAYIDFGNQSAVPLVKKYANLIVIHTMSKSSNLAGVHIGYCFASETLICQLNRIRYALNSHNMSYISQAIGIAAINDDAYYLQNIKKRIDIRTHFTNKMKELGFVVVPSSTNFVLVTHPHLSAIAYQSICLEHRILIRHYDIAKISNFVRITIGTQEQMDALYDITRDLLLSDRIITMNKDEKGSKNEITKRNRHLGYEADYTS